jgi:hypothetical protein
MKRYIIVSLSKSTPDTVVFWRADNAGYTSIPFLAGLYTEQEILNDLEYYTENSVPVPIEEFSNAGLKVTVNEKLIKAFRSGWKSNKLSKAF